MSSSSEYHRNSRRSGPLFTSRKAAAGPGLENSCELPFGFVWSPLLESSEGITDTTVVSSGINLPAGVLCLTCLSYLNLYADYYDEEWICSLCGARNIGTPELFATPVGGPSSQVVTSPVMEFRQTIAPAPPNVCNVILLMDANLPRSEALAVGKVMQTVFHSDVTSSNMIINLGLVIFGETISIHQLGIRNGMACADVITIQQYNDDDDDLSWQYDKKPYLRTLQAGDDDSLECLWLCLSAVYGVDVDDANHTMNDDGFVVTDDEPKSRLEMLKRRKQARLAKQQQQTAGTATSNNSANGVKSPWTELCRRQREQSSALRCTGEAIQVAIDLAASTAARTSRILIFTNGCPNYGNGSVVSSAVDRSIDVVDPMGLARAMAYFDLVAKSVEHAGIDVLCTGSSELAMQSYQALVEHSSGYVLPHESFTSQHLQCNLKFLLQQTYMSAVESDQEDEVPLDMDGCIIDLRMSRYVNAPTMIWQKI